MPSLRLDGRRVEIHDGDTVTIQLIERLPR